MRKKSLSSLVLVFLVLLIAVFPAHAQDGHEQAAEPESTENVDIAWLPLTIYQWGKPEDVSAYLCNFTRYHTQGYSCQSELFVGNADSVYVPYDWDGDYDLTSCISFGEEASDGTLYVLPSLGVCVPWGGKVTCIFGQNGGANDAWDPVELPISQYTDNGSIIQRLGYSGICVQIDSIGQVTFPVCRQVETELRSEEAPLVLDPTTKTTQAESAVMVNKSESDPLVVLGVCTNWFLVQTADQRLGWIFDEYTSLSVEEVDVEICGGNYQVVDVEYELGCWDLKIPAGMNLRSGPGTNYSVLGVSEKMSRRAFASAKDGEWYVYADSDTGVTYVAGVAGLTVSECPEQ